MKIRCFSIAFACALSAAGFASFDMLLVADGVNQKIQRYDGNTGVYLGGLTVYGGNPQGVAAKSGSQEISVTVFSSGRTLVERYNWSTGEFLGSFLPSGDIISNDINYDNSGNLIFGNGARYTPTGVPITPRIRWTANAFNEAHTVQASNGLYYQMAYSNNAVYPTDRIMAFNSSNVFQTNMVFGSDSQTLNDLAIQDSTLVCIREVTSTRKLEIYNIGAGGGLTLQNQMLPTYNGGYLEMGHGTSGYFIAYDGTNWGASRYSTLGLSMGARFFMPQVGSAYGTAIVLAPEPGSVVALALGVGALLRRRRAK